MKKITMFYLKRCPYCKKAFSYIDELKKERPEYLDIEFELIEESEQPELAAKYDYYYVPTFFIDGKKVFEGAPRLTDIEKVLSLAVPQTVSK